MIKIEDQTRNEEHECVDLTPIKNPLVKTESEGVIIDGFETERCKLHLYRGDFTYCKECKWVYGLIPMEEKQKLKRVRIGKLVEIHDFNIPFHKE